MKLYEEFKLFEEMWDKLPENENTDTANNTLDETKEFYKTLGRKKYNLQNDIELQAYIKARVAFNNSKYKSYKPTPVQAAADELDTINSLLAALIKQNAPETLINKLYSVQIQTEHKFRQEKNKQWVQNNTKMLKINLCAAIKDKMQLFDYIIDPTVVNDTNIEDELSNIVSKYISAHIAYVEANSGANGIAKEKRASATNVQE